MGNRDVPKQRKSYSWIVLVLTPFLVIAGVLFAAGLETAQVFLVLIVLAITSLFFWLMFGGTK
jgi:hypothetical protein